MVPSLAQFSSHLKDWGVFFAVFVSASIVYFLLWKVVFNVLAKRAAATPANWDDVLVANVRGPVFAVIWACVLATAFPFAPGRLVDQPYYLYGIKVGFILSGTWLIERIFVVLLRTDAVPVTLTETTKTLLKTVFRLIIFSTGAMIILDTGGISITPLLTSLGVGSIVVAMALQETLSNLFSGIYLMVDQPIRLGDFVKIGDTEGYVTKIGWRNTHIRMFSSATVVIPNGKIASNPLTNYYLPEAEISVYVKASVSFDTDLQKVEDLIIEVAKRILSQVQGGVKTHQPLVRFGDPGPNGYAFTVILRAEKFVDGYVVKHEFLKMLNQRLKQEGISISYPTQTVHLLDSRRQEASL